MHAFFIFFFLGHEVPSLSYKKTVCCADNRNNTIILSLPAKRRKIRNRKVIETFREKGNTEYIILV